MTYAEYLKSQGASEEDIKVLDTAVARKGFEKLQADAQAATERATAAETRERSERKVVEDWRDNQIIPLVAEMQKKVVLAEANEARSKQAIKTLQDQGLIDIAKDMGYETAPAPNAPPAGAPAGFDASKYFTKEDVVNIARKEGQAIAKAQDIAAEHIRLFPDKPLSFSEMHAKAEASGKSVEQVWMDTYGVVAARDARAAADKTAYETKLREEGASAERTRLSSEYGNPDTRPLSPSTSPFAPRPNAGREQQPWEVTDRSNDRVARATKVIMDIGSGRAH